MKQFFGMSQSGNLQEAVRGLSSPRLILLLSNSSQFEAHVKKLEELYPRVPSIGDVETGAEGASSVQTEISQVIETSRAELQSLRIWIT